MTEVEKPREIDLLKTKSLPTLVQEEIIRMIREGELSTGDKLNEVALASRLGVSRGPVREAFRTLVESGMLRQERNRGVFVRTLTVDEAIEIYAVRKSLERLVGESVAARVTDEEIADLERLVERMEAAARSRDIRRYYPLNLAFHETLLELSGNGKLIAMSRRLIDELHLFRRRSLVQGGGMAVSNDEHRRILTAVAGRDPKAAGEALAGHVEEAQTRLLKSLRR